MAYYVIEMDSDFVTTKEAEALLQQITPIKSYREIKESEYYDLKEEEQ